MDAVNIYEEAARKVGRGEINLKEFWKLIKPLRDVEAVVRCKDCLHNRACEIQYHAQAGDLFFCGAAERKGGDGSVLS